MVSQREAVYILPSSLLVELYLVYQLFYNTEEMLLNKFVLKLTSCLIMLH